MSRILFLLLLTVPLLELYLILRVGSVIGVGATLLVIILTAMAGAFLVRQAGLHTLREAQASADRGELPAKQLLEGLAILVAAVLLLTPGFATDTVGFLLLVPAVRAKIAHSLLRQAFAVHIRTVDGDIIEGEFRDDDDRPRLP